MARLRLAPFLDGISGRMAGVVYRVTKFGTDMAEFQAASNPRTPPQTAVRSAFNKATKQWKNLTRPQADAWRAYAKGLFRFEPIGENMVRPTGFNAFVALAAKYFAVTPGAATAPASPPQAPFDGDSITVTVAPGPGGTLIFTASGANATNVTTALLVQRVPNANAAAIRGRWRIAQFKAFAAGSLTAQVQVGPGFYAVGYQFTSAATGQVSDPVYLPAIVGPVSFSVRDGGKKAA
jgi:hypothetical protein